MNNEKMNELSTNEAFKEALSKATSIEEIQKVFSEYGLDLTLDEVKSIITGKNGELSDDELENVAGGSIEVRVTVGPISVSVRVGK